MVYLSLTLTLGRDGVYVLDLGWGGLSECDLDLGVG